MPPARAWHHRVMASARHLRTVRVPRYCHSTRATINKREDRFWYWFLNLSQWIRNQDPSGAPGSQSAWDVMYGASVASNSAATKGDTRSSRRLAAVSLVLYKIFIAESNVQRPDGLLRKSRAKTWRGSTPERAQALAELRLEECARGGRWREILAASLTMMLIRAGFSRPELARLLRDEPGESPTRASQRISRVEKKHKETSDFDEFSDFP